MVVTCCKGGPIVRPRGERGRGTLRLGVGARGVGYHGARTMWGNIWTRNRGENRHVRGGT